MKKTKILVPALSILALGMAASVTGTVAWFTTTAIANANGMQVTSVVPSSLYIDDQIFASSEGVSLSLDSVAHGAHTTALNPAHMAFAANALTAKEAATYEDGYAVGQGTAGIAATFNNKAVLTGSKDTSSNPNKAQLAETGEGAGAYFAYYPESLVRKQSGSDAKFSLSATVTVSGVDATDSLERKAYDTIRVGFMYSVDDGANWLWSTKQVDTNKTSADTIASSRNSGRPETLSTALDTESNNASGTYCTNWNFMGGEHYTTVANDLESALATTNNVFVVVPVIWLEGEDSSCFAINFQNAYNWTISIQYKIAA